MKTPSDLQVYYTLLLAPALTIIALLTLFPLSTVLIQSFHEFDYIQGDKEFVAWANYLSISRDPSFWKALKNTFVFSLSATILETSTGFLLALLFFKPFKGKRMFSLFFMSPMMISTMVVCALWRSLYNYDIGVFNHLVMAGWHIKIPWLISPDLALISILFVDNWQWAPFVFILMSAALQTLPRDVLEAAEIDGCGKRRMVYHVIVPLIGPSLATAALLRTIDTFRLFSKVYALTGGGPGNSTETLSYYIYREAFSYFHFGRSGSASVISFSFILLVAGIYIPKILKGDK